MISGRGWAAARALICALAVAGCGFGPGPSIGDVELTVTRDYGSKVFVQRNEGDVSESETAMRLLDRNADISTRYGGGFVQSIDGIEGDRRGGRQYDWFFYVNGVESPVGAADYGLSDGYRVWWDYRDWTAAMRVPAVVGSYPEPFIHGYEGERHPVRLRCLGVGSACRIAGARLRAAGVDGREGEGAPIRILVGPWELLRSDPAAGPIERGPSHSGVFADFIRNGDSWQVQSLDVRGRPAGSPRAGGLVAATRNGDDPPTWVVTGTEATDVTVAAGLLSPSDLRDHYAVATDAGEPIPLPAP